MAKAIKTIHDRIRAKIKKGVTGYVTPEQIDDEIFAESMNLWRKYLDEFERTKKINTMFRPFVAPKTFAASALSGSAAEGSVNIFNVDSNLEHRYVVDITSDTGKSVSLLSLGEYRHRFNHPFKNPTVNFPIAKTEGQLLFVAPKVGVTVTFIKRPVKTKYAYTPVSGTKLLYNDDNSIDIEWPIDLHDDIVNRVVENISIMMRDGQLTQYAQIQKAQEGK